MDFGAAKAKNSVPRWVTLHEVHLGEQWQRWAGPPHEKQKQQQRTNRRTSLADPSETEGWKLMSQTITLAEAAERLGVHYMTAYRYVRTGRLPATKADGQWQVNPDDLDSLDSGAPTPGPRKESIPPRLLDRLVAGDEIGAFQLLEGAMGSGADPEEVYLDLLAPAMVDIGERWHNGEISIADEHLATSTALRVVARIGSRLAPRGRTKGTVILATVSDDYHYLPTALLRDLLRNRAFEVVDLGANTPPESIVDRINTIDNLVAIGLASTNPGNDDIVAVTLEVIAETTDTPVIVGGTAFASREQIEALGPCLPSMSAREALELVDAIHAGVLHR